MTTIGTINEEGLNVDLYIPRKCHASNTLIAAFDYAAIQLNIGEIDTNGVYTGSTKTLCIAGFLRAEGESDHAVNRLCITHGIIRARTGKPKKQKKRLPARQPAKAAPGAAKRGGAAPARRQAPAAAGARKPQGERKPAGDRKPREQREPRGDRAQGERPQGERKPREQREPRGDRPQGERPQGERKPREQRPAPTGEKARVAPKAAPQAAKQ